MKNKKAVMIVALALAVLVAAPVVILTILKQNSLVDETKVDKFLKRGDAVDISDIEVRQLADRAAMLVRKDLGDALRDKTVSIDFVALARKDLKQADRALAKGKTKDAVEGYRAIIEVAESQLSAIEFAEPARELKDSVYAALEEAVYLKSSFTNSYDEAINQYNTGLQAYEIGNYEESVDEFELAGDMLENLKERADQQLEAAMEAAEVALAELDLEAARSAFEKALEIQPSNSKAREGLVQLSALEEIAAELEPIHALREAGENEEALAQIEELIVEDPDSELLLAERESIQAAIVDSEHEALLEKARIAESKSNIPAAISALEAANKLRASTDITSRIADLKAQEKALGLKTLLETGYNAMKAGSFDAAKQAYEEALALDPDSEEARTGF